MPLPTGPAPLNYPGGGEPGLAEAALPGDPGSPRPDVEAIEPSTDGTDDTADSEPESDGPVPAGDDPTIVWLPDGETVTAASPQLAGAITAVLGGTPIADAFREQGITIPLPGSAVPNPVEPGRLVPGDIGIFTDRHALALGNGKAVLNNQMQPIASVTGPSFLGWEHPPNPGATSPSSESDVPAPTRPAVTAGPSG